MKLKNFVFSIVFAIIAVSFVACTVPQTVTKPDGTISTNHIVDPKLENGLIAARTVNAASAPFNPFAYATEIALSLATVGAGWVAKRKNDKSAANELLLKTVIQAIDSLDDEKIKGVIQDHAVKIGVEGELNTAVKKVGSGLL